MTVITARFAKREIFSVVDPMTVASAKRLCCAPMTRKSAERSSVICVPTATSVASYPELFVQSIDAERPS